MNSFDTNTATFMNHERNEGIECPFHQGETAYVQMTVEGDVIYSCRKTGQRIFDQDAVE